MAKNQILIVAGELSGDKHGSELINRLKKKNPELSFYGLGGDFLKASGVAIHTNIVEMAVVGFQEVVKSYFKFKKILKNILKEVDRSKPACAILIDYPGFNLVLAKELHKRQIPIIYYISPQIWAWHFSRIKKIKRYVNEMLVFFSFEKNIYDEYNIPCTFTGHPLIDKAHPSLTREIFCQKFSIDPSRKIISLMPGSRKKEVLTLLTPMIKTAELIFNKYPDTFFLIPKASHLPQNIFEDELKKTHIPFKLIEDSFYNCIHASQFALVASGTATLETAIINVPMFILYKVAPLSALLGRFLIRIPYLGLVNVVRGKKIVPEFLQEDLIPEKIACHFDQFVSEKALGQKMKKEFGAVRSLLGPGKAYDMAAKRVDQIIQKFKSQQ